MITKKNLEIFLEKIGCPVDICQECPKCIQHDECMECANVWKKRERWFRTHPSNLTDYDCTKEKKLAQEFLAEYPEGKEVYIFDETSDGNFPGQNRYYHLQKYLLKGGKLIDTEERITIGGIRRRLNLNFFQDNRLGLIRDSSFDEEKIEALKEKILNYNFIEENNYLGSLVDRIIFIFLLPEEK